MFTGVRHTYYTLTYIISAVIFYLLFFLSLLISEHIGPMAKGKRYARGIHC